MLAENSEPWVAVAESRDAEAPTVEVSVVMPCLNEAATLGRCITKARNALEKLQLRGEIIVADNGSTDGSPQIAQGMGVRVVHVPTGDMAVLSRAASRQRAANSS